jgi:hypothetical protein
MPPAPIISMRELARIIASGEAMLFTGAGFSSDARDVDGRPLPDSRQMIAELWAMCFGEGEPDDSSLADLYDVALRQRPDELRAYLARRLRIGDAPLPQHLGRWFAAPWRRIYTLNVDDLETAVGRQFALPRRLRTVSAIGEAHEDPDAIEVVHLNGVSTGDPTELTFSTLQYAERLCGHDRHYECLAADLDHAPFVFAGTTLDEVMLWQHLELRRRRNHRPVPRPPAFLVASSLSRARQALLETMQIRWIRTTIDRALG